MKIRFAIVMLILCGCITLQAADSFVVLDGNKQAVIVYNPAEPAYHVQIGSTVFDIKAHEDLANYLHKTTGKSFTMLPQELYKPDANSFPIYVGNCTVAAEAIGSKLSKLDRDAFMIVIEPNRIFLAGNQNYSTSWAVSKFLEDYIGVRWLFPGPLGEDIPSLNKIVLDPISVIEEPVILGRLWSGADHAPGGLAWSFRQRIYYKYMTGHTIRGRYEFHHNMSVIFPPDKYFDQHPEYYALIGGKREKEGFMHGVNLCHTDPNTIKIAAQAAIDHFKSDPDAESYSFGPDDGSRWCECDKCRKIFLKDSLWQNPDPNDQYHFVWRGYTRASALYWNWVSKVAAEVKKVYPNKKIGTLAYSAYTCPSVDNPEIIIDRDIQPYICLTLADIWYPPHKQAVYQLMTQWSKRVDSFGLYDYAYGVFEVMPRIYTPLVQQIVKDALPLGLKGCYAEVYPNWALDGPRLYQTARIWWNPNIDSKAVFNDWCEHAFKEAAEPMKKHFTRCEDQWINTDQVKFNFKKRPGQYYVSGFNGKEKYYFESGWRTTPFEIFTPEVVAEHTAYFDQAAKMAKSEIVKQRIDWYRNAWNLTVAFADAYWAGEGLETYIARGATLKQAVAALRKMPQSYDIAYQKKLITDRVGNDPVAFYPIKAENDNSFKHNILVKPVKDSELLWCAQQIAAEVKRYYQENMLSDPPIEQAVQTKVSELLERDSDQMPQIYKDAVAKIKQYAADEIKKDE